jgi:predicted RNA-binding protein with PUA-like domain
MNYWLVKTEPGTFAWQELVERGAKGEPWDGVRNHQAANFLRAMADGDEVFVYHSGKTREIVGIARVIRTHFPDPTDDSGRFVAVQLRALKPLNKPVTLTAIKADPQLQDLLLVRHSRLSVMPVGELHWGVIQAMGQSR